VAVVKGKVEKRQHVGYIEKKFLCKTQMKKILGNDKIDNDMMYYQQKNGCAENCTE